MQLIKPTKVNTRPAASWPNMFIFPRELRDLIPEHSARALIVDEVRGTKAPHALSPREDYGAPVHQSGPRARVQFVIHETEPLSGRLPLYLDLDPPTMRSLGQFMIQLAAECEAQGDGPRSG